MEKLNLIVYAGSQSKLFTKNSNIFRAITTKELKSLMDLVGNGVILFEHIDFDTFEIPESFIILSKDNSAKDIFGERAKIVQSEEDIYSSIENSTGLSIRYKNQKQAENEDKINSDWKNKALKLQEELKSVKSAYDIEINALKPMLDELEIENASLIDDNEELEDTIEEIQDKNDDLMERCIFLEEELENTKEELKNLDRNRIDLKYQGSALLLPVFGSGSHGVTGIATSLSRVYARRGMRTVFIDFNIRSPKADTWFRKSPIEDDKRTALERFVNGDKFEGKQVENNLVYLGGYYNKVDDKFWKCDWSWLLTTLGNEYDVIVIDFGILGFTEEITDMLVSLKNCRAKPYYVVRKDTFDVRDGVYQLNLAGFSKSDVNWVLNYSNSESMGERIEKYIGEEKVLFIPFRVNNVFSRDDFCDEMELFV